MDWRPVDGTFRRYRIAKVYENQRSPFYGPFPNPGGQSVCQKPCQGLDIIVEDWSKVDSMELGIGLALALGKVHGDIWQVGKMEKLLVNKAALAMIREQKPLDAILASFAPGLLEFEAVRKGVLLYP